MKCFVIFEPWSLSNENVISLVFFNEFQQTRCQNVQSLLKQHLFSPRGSDNFTFLKLIFRNFLWAVSFYLAMSNSNGLYLTIDINVCVLIENRNSLSLKSKSYLISLTINSAQIMGKLKQLIVIIFTGLCLFTIWSIILPRFMISEIERDHLRATLKEYGRIPSQHVQWNPSCIIRWDSDCVCENSYTFSVQIPIFQVFFLLYLSLFWDYFCLMLGFFLFKKMKLDLMRASKTLCCSHL